MLAELDGDSAADLVRVMAGDLADLMLGRQIVPAVDAVAAAPAPRLRAGFQLVVLGVAGPAGPVVARVGAYGEACQAGVVLLRGASWGQVQGCRVGQVRGDFRAGKELGDGGVGGGTPVDRVGTGDVDVCCAPCVVGEHVPDQVRQAGGDDGDLGGRDPCRVEVEPPELIDRGRSHRIGLDGDEGEQRGRQVGQVSARGG